MTAALEFTGWDADANARPNGRVNDLHHRGRFSRPTPTNVVPAGIVARRNQPDLSLPFWDRRGSSAPCGRERGIPRSNDPRGIGRAGVTLTPAPLSTEAARA